MGALAWGCGVRARCMGTGICVAGWTLGRISVRLILFGAGLGRRLADVPLAAAGAVEPGLSAPGTAFTALELPGATVGVGAGEGGRRLGVDAQLLVSTAEAWLIAELVKNETVPDTLCSQSCTTVSIQV